MQKLLSRHNFEFSLLLILLKYFEFLTNQCNRLKLFGEKQEKLKFEAKCGYRHPFAGQNCYLSCNQHI